MDRKGSKDKESFIIIIDCENEETYRGANYIVNQYFKKVKILTGPDSKYNISENIVKSETKKNIPKKISMPKKKHTLDDVIGLDEAKKNLRRFTVYDRFKEVEKITGMGMPKGFILHGDPGVGKTYLYEAVVNEAELNGIKVGSTNISPSTHGSSLINQFSLNIMKEYKKAVKRLEEGKTRLELIFLDETDSVARDRGKMQSNEENIKVVNTFNEIIDGVHRYEDLYFIACTNRIEDIDSAFVRSGRITPVKCPRPDKKGLDKLFRQYVKKIKSNSEIELFGKLNYSELTEAGFKKEFTGADVNDIFIFAGMKCQESMLYNKNLKKPSSKINQKDVLDLIKNFDRTKKGEKFNKNLIGFDRK